jgi:hypothetical protein
MWIQCIYLDEYVYGWMNSIRWMFFTHGWMFLNGLDEILNLWNNWVVTSPTSISILFKGET